jgi:hypothetical protein
MRSKESSFPSGLRQADQGRTRDLHRFERSLSCRSLGSSHGEAPQERLFVIDVALASVSPSKTECQYVKDVPIYNKANQRPIDTGCQNGYHSILVQPNRSGIHNATL